MEEEEEDDICKDVDSDGHDDDKMKKMSMLIPWVWGTLDGFLSVLAPCPQIGGAFGGRLMHHLLLLVLPVKSRELD